LVLLYDDRRVVVRAFAWAVQVGAGLAFLSLWLADRFGRVESSFDDGIKNAFLCAAFFLPALIGIWVAVGGVDARVLAGGIVAALALLVVLREFTRRRLAAWIILASALVFAASSAAWTVEQRLVWAIWIVAAALTQLIYARTRATLLIWLAEAFAAVAVIAYLNQSPVQPWLRLLAPAAWSALAGWRFGWGQE